MKEDLARQFKKLIYGTISLKWANYFVNVAKKASDIFSSFVGGQITEAIILGVLMYVGMTLLGFPYKLSVSAITGALALIPIYGALLGGVVGFILISDSCGRHRLSAKLAFQKVRHRDQEEVRWRLLSRDRNVHRIGFCKAFFRPVESTCCLCF